MTTRPFVFGDGDAYEQTMVAWLNPLGEAFLDWLAPPSGLRWLDVGCGTGASAELLIRRCAPQSVEGIDPSESMLNVARTRPSLQGMTLRSGSAMALPYEANGFGATLMAGVLPAVPDPVRCVSEMARVVRSDGFVGLYHWDIPASGFPHEPLLAGMKALSIAPPEPPSAAETAAARGREVLRAAGLVSVESFEVTIERSFPDFESYWHGTAMSTLRPTLAALSPDDILRLKEAVRREARGRPDGSFSGRGLGVGVKGRVA